MTEFKIEGPGEYRTRDGRKAVVEMHVIEEGMGIMPFQGRVSVYETWFSDGTTYLGRQSPEDIVGPWVELDPEEDDDLTADVITTSIALAAIEDGIDTDEDYDVEPEQPSQPAPVLPGITLRDWLAGMAMQGLMPRWLTAQPFDVWAARSVEAADAMLKALEEKP